MTIVVVFCSKPSYNYRLLQVPFSVLMILCCICLNLESLWLLNFFSVEIVVVVFVVYVFFLATLCCKQFVLLVAHTLTANAADLVLNCVVVVVVVVIVLLNHTLPLVLSAENACN